MLPPLGNNTQLNLMKSFGLIGCLLRAWDWNFDILRIQQIQPSSNKHKMALSCPCCGDGSLWTFGFLEILVGHQFGSVDL